MEELVPSLPDIACTRVARGPRIGTCGFGLAMSSYARSFSCVEIQHTFYQPPRLATLERWREAVPADFEFTLKAWQLITHNAKSPTYRRLKRKLSETERQEAGYFRATAIVSEAWEVTLASARALRAKTILFQCPASFGHTRENVASLEKFFSSIDRHELNLCWEPRGDWDSETVNSICSAFDLSHVVDPFIATTVTPDKYYFRLHGRDGWRYQYGLDELEELASNAEKMKASKASYVFFNNRTMTDDALRFCRLVS